MVHVLGEHLDRWFRRHPNQHRTDMQGQRMVCPRPDRIGYPVEFLRHRPNSSIQPRCPFCNMILGHAVSLTEPEEKGEFLWTAVA